MTRLPRGKMIQKHIDTTYVRLDGVLESLHNETFSGYVRIVYEDAEGLLFYRDADLIAGILERQEGTLTGPDALVEILRAPRERRAFLDICRIEHDLLAAILALTHGAPRELPPSDVPADPSALLRAVERLHVTGALLVEGADGARYFFASAGEFLGEWRPDLEEWRDLPEALPAPVAPWRIWDRGEAATMRTIDLATQKERVYREMEEIVERFAPGFGVRLFRLECRYHKIEDPRTTRRSAFTRLVEGLRRRGRLVIGEKRGWRMAGELESRLSTVIDAGY